jgi:hypothetical protein
MRSIERCIDAAAAASDFGDIWRSRLNFTSSAVSASPLWVRLARPQMEDPGQPVVGHGPALGNAGPHAALFEVERDKAVIDCGLVDGVARAAFEDRIEGLGSKRFNGENQGTF